jgi:hypothetical protein
VSPSSAARVARAQLIATGHRSSALDFDLSLGSAFLNHDWRESIGYYVP